MSSILNKILDVFHSICLSVINSLGFSPFIGFFHSNSPIPFVYDIADLHKAKVTIEPSFKYLSLNYGQTITKENIIQYVTESAEDNNLLSLIHKDIKNLLKDFKR